MKGPDNAFLWSELIVKTNYDKYCHFPQVGMISLRRLIVASAIAFNFPNKYVYHYTVRVFQAVFLHDIVRDFCLIVCLRNLHVNVPQKCRCSYQFIFKRQGKAGIRGPAGPVSLDCYLRRCSSHSLKCARNKTSDSKFVKVKNRNKKQEKIWETTNLSNDDFEWSQSKSTPYE